MKTLNIIMAALLPLVSFARLGETPAECAKRYGVPVRTDATGVVHYRFTGMEIAAVFDKGVCSHIEFEMQAPLKGQRPQIKGDVIDEIIKSNGGGTLKAVMPTSMGSGDNAARIGAFVGGGKQQPPKKWINADGTLRAEMDAKHMKLMIEVTPGAPAKKEKGF